jgi:alkylhydroperoxidase/carboxymuconolactone decarboxylase family protein YurZ
LEQGKLSAEDMKQIMPHIAIYCGFPVEMNGLAILNKIQQEI